MATHSDTQAVKSLNQSSGNRRFTFKTFSQRIEEIDIDVYRSLEQLKSEPSEGSSFFRDCLIECREINTAEDFMSFYEEMFPLVQTLPQIILQKELILSSLLSRLKMRGILSLEPTLRLVASLSRDLLEDFIPFLQRIADSFACLLECGADREPEIIEQIFTSWSYILMYLQKYLTRKVGNVLSITVSLRYYHREYVRELMAESVSFLLRKTPIQQLKQAVRNVVLEVVEEPSETRKSGVSVLLSHVMRITSSKLHSKAETVLALLVDNSFIGNDNESVEGSTIFLEVLNLTFQKLCAELDPVGLNCMCKCLCGKITDCVANGNPLHLRRLLSVLISSMQNGYAQKIFGCTDYKQMLQLVGLLVQTFVIPHLALQSVDQLSEIMDKILELMLCTLDGLCNPQNKLALLSISSQWGPVFNLRNQSLLAFIRDLLSKDPFVLRVFGTNILSALNNLIEGSGDDVIDLLLTFCEKMEALDSGFFDEISLEKHSRICIFLHERISLMISLAINGSVQFQENRLHVMWGVIGCYPHVADAQEKLLMDLINALDELLMTGTGQTCIARKNICQSLIGTALRSYHKLVFSQNCMHNESVMRKFLDLAKRYKSSRQILSAVADILDSVSGSMIGSDTNCKCYHPELVAGKVVGVLDIFAENLCHADKEIRLSTLRILCHYEPLNYEILVKEHSVANKVIVDGSETCHVDDQNNVLKLLRSIEETSLSIATSRKVNMLISAIQMALSAGKVAEQYMSIVLYGIIGIFHNRFSYLWNPVMECLSVLIGQYFEILWEKYVRYLDHCQSIFLLSHDKSGRGRVDAQSNHYSDLAGRFNSFVFPPSDSTSCTTVLSLLIQSLQKVLPVVESRSRQIIPLFLIFLGYNVDDLSSVASHTLDPKGKDWKGVLKEWLSLLRLLRNPKAFYQSQFLKDVLQFRLLDKNDAELQMKVLDSMLNWKDEFLIPYNQQLKNLINAKNLREELTTWSLSRESDLLDVQHRAHVVPIVIRLLVPKVRKLKTLASKKNTSVQHRRAILGFLAQLDVDELHLFFALLIKPLLFIPQGVDETSTKIWNLCESCKYEFDTSSVLRYFTLDTITTLSLKKWNGFLHVVEDIFTVFGEKQLNQFLDLLAGIVVRILASCTSSLDSSKIIDVDIAEHIDEAEDQIMMRTSVKQFKELRSLSLKIIYLILSKYEDHDWAPEFWDLFFTSVKPLISNFKKEGASSKKPSSLFSCFLAMSRSYKLVPLLYRERNLVPDIFSVLTVTTASEHIVSSVFEFIKNLLQLDGELGDEGSCVKNMLLTHIDLLLNSLQNLFTDNATKRKLVKCPGKRELTIFKLLLKYVKKPSAAEAFIDILLPLLKRRPQSSDAHCDTLHIIGQVVTVLGRGSSKKILSAVSPLLISAEPVVRICICDVVDALATNESSLLTVAKLLRELNATSAIEMGGLDYDKITLAYENINSEFFYSVQEEHALLILSHSVHDMMSEELIFRQSAFRLFLSFIEFAAKIFDGVLKSDQELWSEASVLHVVNDFILKHMGNAMVKRSSIQKVWIDLLQELVLKLTKVTILESYRALSSDDPEQDFFENIFHLQTHKRVRALSRFRNIVGLGNLSAVITNKVFVPLLFSMLVDVQNGKDEHVKSACLDALASVSGCMKWKQYYTLLTRCFREMISKPDKQKLLLRLINSILDHFHFSEARSVSEIKDSAIGVPDPYTIGMTSSITLRKCNSSAELPVIQTCLRKNILPEIQKLLSFDSENVNVSVSLVAIKILKLLPGEIMDTQLPNVIHCISNFLKNRLESVRDQARSALAAFLKELGSEYLQLIVKVLKGILKRGYELHVLGYTLNFILSKFLSSPLCGNLDYCLEDLLSVIENDILGDVSEEKEVDKIAIKMKETRNQKSYETLKLLAKSITFKTHVLKLLSLVTVHLQKPPTRKLKLKLENMLNHIAAGIGCNPSVNQTELFIFTHRLIEESIGTENDEYETIHALKESKLGRDEHYCLTIDSDRLIRSDQQCAYLMTAFALGVLQNYIKKLKFDKENYNHLLQMLDPFLSLLCKCLSSKYENTISAAIGCLTLLVTLPLPSLESQAFNIKTSLLAIAQGSVNASSQSMESCIKLLTGLLRSTEVTLSADQLRMLIQFPWFVDLEKNATSFSLSLLKAVVRRKLVVPEIYDVVVRVAELMVTSQLETVRKKCSEILLQYLLRYQLSEKRLQEHLDFLLANLRYEHSTGREAVLEMLYAVMLKFPKLKLDKQSETVFVCLVVCLANDEDGKVRSMAAAAIKCLVEHVNSYSLHTILEYSLSWYVGEKQNLLGAAAQVLGLLVEVMRDDFEKHLNRVLQPMRSILSSAVTALTRKIDHCDKSVISCWKEAYYSLIMLKKILNQFKKLCFNKDLEDIWDIICELLLHPHLWVRKISNCLVDFYFDHSKNPEVSKESFFLMRPGRLFSIAASLCCQLKVPLNDDAAGTLIEKNLESSICGLHSSLEKNDYVNPTKFWSNLEHDEQEDFFKAFHVLDSKNGRSTLVSFTSDLSIKHDAENDKNHQHLFVSYLLQKMGKISLQMEAPQIKIVFNCFKSIFPKLAKCNRRLPPIGEDGRYDCHDYAFEMLFPLYKVCEGFTGRVISDDLKRLALEVCGKIRDEMKLWDFYQIYSRIEKILKVKRDKRKRGEKIMAVVNPMQNAKRKLKVAAKHRANKKRKIMTMKMGKWMQF